MSGDVQDERLVVWRALAELFLDDDLGEADADRIARQLATSGHSLEELDEILLFEVYPSCRWNLRAVAGAWGDWGDEWIMEHIAPLKNQRPHRVCLGFRRWLMHRQWHGVSRLTPWPEISRRVAQLRLQGAR